MVFGLVLLGAVMGAATLLLGGLRSRAAITLLVMCAGIAIGRAMPWWFGWSTEPNATAILGAIVGAALGFLLHRFWIAVGVGYCAAILAAVVVWYQADGPHTFALPPLEAGQTAQEYAHLAWEHTPRMFRDNLVVTCAPIFLVFAVLAFIFHRVAVALFYSLWGAMLLSASLLLGEVSGRMPQIKNLLPALIELRVLLFAGMVLLGTLVQLSLIRPKRPAQPAAPALPEDDS